MESSINYTRSSARAKSGRIEQRSGQGRKELLNVNAPIKSIEAQINGLTKELRGSGQDRENIGLQIRHLNVVIEQQSNEIYQSMSSDIDKVRKLLNSYVSEDSSTSGFLQHQISNLITDKVKIQQNLAALDHKFTQIHGEFTHEDDK